MKIKVGTILLQVGVFFAGLLTLGVAAYMVVLSHDVARANPTITYMRVPVLLMAWAFLGCVLAALVLTFLLLKRIQRDNIFENESVRLLKGIGLCSYLAILPLVILLFYTAANVSGSITNLYVVLGIFAMILIGIFFYLIAALFQKAVDYKHEVDLTV